MRKLFRSLAIAGAATAVSLGGTALAQQPLRMGFIYVGPVGDGGWTFAHDLGRKAMEAKLKGKVQTTFVESVPEGADAERVGRDMASKGHQIVLSTSFGSVEQTV